MSVGIVALRANPERFRQACIDKGEDPSFVDLAVQADARRRDILAERDALRAERNARSREIGDITRELNSIVARLERAGLL